MQTSMCRNKVINILAIYLCQNIKYYSNSFKSSWQVNSKLQHLLLCIWWRPSCCNDPWSSQLWYGCRCLKEYSLNFYFIEIIINHLQLCVISKLSEVEAEMKRPRVMKDHMPEVAFWWSTIIIDQLCQSIIFRYVKSNYMQKDQTDFKFLGN